MLVSGAEVQGGDGPEMELEGEEAAGSGPVATRAAR